MLEKLEVSLTMPIKEWGSILDNLLIFFGERVKITL